MQTFPSKERCSASESGATIIRRSIERQPKREFAAQGFPAWSRVGASIRNKRDGAQPELERGPERESNRLTSVPAKNTDGLRGRGTSEAEWRVKQDQTRSRTIAAAPRSSRDREHYNQESSGLSSSFLVAKRQLALKKTGNEINAEHLGSQVALLSTSMSEETAINAHGSAYASTSSSPRTSVATLSRQNSTASSPASPRSPRHKGISEKRTSGRFLAALADGVGNAEGYISDQQPGTLPLPRYPSVAGAKPLAPHRVARIAHSFGLGAALPAGTPVHKHTTFTYRKSNSANSYSRHHSRQTTATRLLLHVIPPAGLIEGNDLLPSGSTGDPLSKRGSLLPLHTTLQGQLQAIKREYNFPSTAGLILNLLDISGNEDAEKYIGPRISEQTWAALWRPALTMDRREQQSAFAPLPQSASVSTSPPSPSQSPAEDLASDHDSMLTPSSSNDVEPSSAPPTMTRDRTLRPLIIGRGLLTSPSTTTLASVSSFNSVDSFSRSPAAVFPPTPNSAIPPTSNHIPRSESMSAKSDTASFTSSQQRAAPSSIVGKVEFDIDLQKGRWYDQWSARKRAQPPSMLLSARAATTSPPLITNAELAESPSLSLTLAAPFDLKPSLSASSEVSDESPSLAARLALPHSPLPDLSDLEDGRSTPGGYAQLEGEASGSSEYEDEDAAHTRSHNVTDMNEDELAWQGLQAEGNSKRRGEFDADLEGEIEEEDPLPSTVNDATKDLSEVVAIWNERQGTMDSQVTTSSRGEGESGSEEEADGAVLVPVLSSPIVLHSEKDKGADGRLRVVPPPLHLRDATEHADISVQLVGASPSGSPTHESAGFGFASDRVESGLSPSASLDLFDDGSSVHSAASSIGDDEVASQLRLKEKLDSLAKHIALVSPKKLPEEPEWQNGGRTTGTTPTSPATPQFFSNGFARPNPGQPLILTPRSSPELPVVGAAITQSSAVPLDHLVNEMRLNRTTPPSRPISNMSTITGRSQNSSPAPSTPAETRKSVASVQSSSDKSSAHLSTTSIPTPSVADRPATPAVLDPPPRTFSLPQPSSRFSDDSFLSDAQHASEEGMSDAASIGASSMNSTNPSIISASNLTTPTNPNNPNARISVRNFTKLFRGRTKSTLSTRDITPPVPTPPVPIPHPQIGAPRAVPAVPPMPSPISGQPPQPRTSQSGSPVVGKPNGSRPGHAREDSGSDPFHFDSPSSKASISIPNSPAVDTPSSGLPTAEGAGPRGSLAARGKQQRGILKGGWGGAGRPNSVRPVAPPPLSPPTGQGQFPPPDSASSTASHEQHARNPSSASSLSARGLRTNHRESWVSIAENMVAGSTSSASSSSTGHGPTSAAPINELMAIDEREATEFAAVTGQQRRETNASLRPPVSPASTESSQGPRPSMDDMSMRSSQFEIVTPLPSPGAGARPPPQRANSQYIGPDRI
ncbi:hypothetical protein DL93DRAFT_2097580 [Clavulina sp. PMI_390]|nr:hypothetical protein DL93DRAFT_2097580 [Clavulina sp. PMI_390]